MSLVYNLKEPIDYNFQGRDFKLKTILFKEPRGEHIIDDFIPACELLKSTEENFIKINEFIEMLDKQQFEGDLTDDKKFYEIVSFFRREIQNKSMDDKLKLETKVFDSIKQMFFIGQATDTSRSICVNNENIHHALTVREYASMNLRDIFAINKLLKDFFFSII